MKNKKKQKINSIYKIIINGRGNIGCYNKDKNLLIYTSSCELNLSSEEVDNLKRMKSLKVIEVVI